MPFAIDIDAAALVFQLFLMGFFNIHFSLYI